VYHNLPSGGALRVLDSVLKQAGNTHQIELFIPETANDTFVPLSGHAKRTHRFDLRDPRTLHGGYEMVRSVPRYGRLIARAIDTGAFDVALVSASLVTQAPEVLPYLSTPSLYYAPEHRRSSYDRETLPAQRTTRDAIFKRVQAPLRAWLKRFDRRATLRASRVFTHSEFAAANLTRVYGIIPEVVRLGVDTDLYRPLDLTREGFLLSVGALDPRKGHDFIIEAIAQLEDGRRPRMHVIADRGEDGPRLTHLADARGVDLELHVDLPAEEVVRLYNRAGVLAAGQIDEPFGLVTLEAMACRTPVVAVDEGGLRESVVTGQTGLLVPRDPRRFADAIESVLRDSGLAERLGTAGREDVLQRWTWSTTAEHVLAMADDLAAA
jgi:glycosyltransferase involved in cell wall biosynthesis